MRGGTLRSAPEAHRIARRRADLAREDAQRLLPALDRAIVRAGRAGRMELEYDLPTLTRAPTEAILRELETTLRTKGYRVERVVGRPRALRVRWDGVAGGLFFSTAYT